MTTIRTTQEKFMHELGDIYDAEQQFLKGQQEMHQHASDLTLKRMIEQHITESQQQTKNLEQVFQALGSQPESVKCQAAAGLVAEAKQNLKDAGTDAIRDTLIGGAIAKVEHYEIASYRGLIIGAQQMGQQQVMQLLQQNLQQEEKTAQLVEQSAPELLQKAMSSEGMQGGQQMGQMSARTMQ